MKYRPEVDGLRALAILFVLFFHAGFKLFASGFIGVDIFFVISGFLITGNIHHALEKGHFSLLEFYNRRLWRMQPILICLLVVSTLLTLVYYLPDDLMQYSKSARKTALFISNDFFGRITRGYFAANSQQLPLLHTWSLSIEWQCYFILPLVMYALHRFFTVSVFRSLVYGLTLLFLGLSLYFSLHFPEKTYYQLGSRVFEFLIGSCVALNIERRVFSQTMVNLLSVLALISLIFVATRQGIQTGFPNEYALLVCLAAALLIVASEQPSKGVGMKLLAAKPVVFIGLISYSLYIWHWPVFALIRYLGIQETAELLFLVFSLIFLLAWLSWRFIEKPARKLNQTHFVYSLTLLFILPLAYTHFEDYFVRQQGGYPSRFKETEVVYAKLKQHASPQRVACLQQESTPVSSNCLMGALRPDSKTALMIGDSFSNHHWKFMESLAKAANVSILSHSTIACLTLPDLFQYEWYVKNQPYQVCRDQIQRYYEMIKAHHYDFVILGQNWNAYLDKRVIRHLSDKQSMDLTQKRIESALNKALKIITGTGAKPVIIKSEAFINENSYECFLKHLKHRRAYHAEECDFELHPIEHQWFNQLFARMKKKYPQLILINPRKVECPQGKCKADIDGAPVFRDSGHLTDYGSFQLGQLYLERFDNPLRLKS